jgi:predicted AAA+ superfamily ATPase
VNGTLPNIFNAKDAHFKETELASYVTLYLEEEIRKEALVRSLAAFSNFFRLACIESGNTVKFRNIAQEIGVSHSTISEYYKILQDCMIVEIIESLTTTTTRRVLYKSPKYLIFDLGVRRLGSKETNNPTVKQLSCLFEQFIGLELIKLARSSEYGSSSTTIKFWKDYNGPEIDYVIDKYGEYIPVEVKWTEKPSYKDCRHIVTFHKEYPTSKRGYIVCNTPYSMQLADNIYAISWRELHKVFS